jgi:mannose-6-phosphate isomerase
LGWTQATTRAEYERRVADGTLGAILRRVPVKAGDTFYLPSGMLHAIGKGIVVYETQQASDLTYRIFDWNRVGTDGKPRELAVKKAGDVLYYGAGTEKALEQIPYRFEGLSRTALIADPRFTVERVVATAEAASLSTGNRPLIITALERAMQIEAGGVTVEAGAYTTTLIPAAAQWCSVRAPGDDAPFMLVTPPADPEQLPVQLLAAGIDQTRVDRFMAQFHPLGVKA